MLLISVIVPVYNAENFLHRCIDSILSQSFQSFELLLIDDGSTDSSGVICDKYAQNDKRIRVFHKSNGGVTSARSLGVDNAKGEWITFVDADDELYSFSIDVLVNNISSDLDIIISDINKEVIISGDEFIKAKVLWNVQASVWGRLYRRAIFDKTAFDVSRDLIVGEDAFMNLRVGANCRYAKCIKQNVYLYNKNPNSITNTRRFSLEYEEYYMSEITRSLGDKKNEFINELNLLKLGALENMIVCRVSVSYKLPWVKELIEWGKTQKLTFRQRVVLNIKHNLLCKYILAVEKRIKRLFANNERI